jgi:hypothetical protein
VYRPDDLLFIVLPSGTLYVTANLSGGYVKIEPRTKLTNVAWIG